MESTNQILLKNIQNSISEVVPKKKIGIAFSGGVDSTLVSKICTDMGFDVVLLTIGFSESHDIVFSKEVNEFLNYSHHVLEIDPETFPKITTDIHKVIDTDNLSWNENCIAFHYVSKLAKSLNLDTVITGNGIDELFCGYNSYREAIEKGEDVVVKMMNDKLKNEKEMMVAINAVTAEFGVTTVSYTHLTLPTKRIV